MQAPDRMFGGDRGGVPRISGITPRMSHESELKAVRVTKQQDVLVVPVDHPPRRHAHVLQVPLPPAEGVLRHRERRHGRLADTDTTARRVPPGKERQQRAGRTGLVPVVEVVGTRIVEVHGGLHEPEPERAQVEVGIAPGIARYRGDVVQPAGPKRHGSSSPSWVPPRSTA